MTPLDDSASRSVRPGRADERRVAAGGRLSFRRNFSWIAAGNAVGAMARWGMFVVLARLGNLEMVGQLVMALAICAPVTSLTSLYLRSVLVTDAKGEHDFRDYLGLRLLSAGLAFVIVLGTVLVLRPGGLLAGVILIVAAGKVFEQISDIFHALFQQQERMNRIGVALIVREVLALAILAAGVLWTGDLRWGAIGLAVAPLVSLLACDVRNAAIALPHFAVTLRATRPHPAEHDDVGPRDAEGDRCNSLWPRWDRRKLVELAWLAAPLGAVGTLLTLQTSFPRYVVGYHLGQSALGVFAAIVYFSRMGRMVVAAMCQSASPRLARYYAAGNPAAFRKMLLKLVGVVSLVGLGQVLVMAVAGRWILLVCYGPEVAEHATLAVWLTAACSLASVSTPLGRAVDAMRRFKTHLAIRVLGLATAAPLLAVLVGVWGLPGAAVAMFLGAVLLIGFYMAAVTPAMRRNLPAAAGREREPESQSQPEPAMAGAA